MKVTLKLDGRKSEDQYAANLIGTAINSRGGQRTDESKLPKAERRQDATIQRAWNAITVPDPESKVPAPKVGWPDARPRILKEEEVEFTLEQPDFERVQKFFDADTMTWLPHATVAAEEVSQRLAAAMAGASKEDAK